MKKIISIMAIFAVVLLAACGQTNKESNQDGKLKVYTTVFPFKSLIQQIGGDHVQVESIYPNGIDIHSFEPTQKDTMKIAKGDLFVYASDDLDPVSAKIAKVIKEDGKKLQALKNVDEHDLLAGEEHEHEHEHKGHDGHDHGAHDPHVWLDPEMNKAFAKAVKDELIKKDKKNKDTYEKNYNKVLKDIESIDKKLKDITKNKKHDTVYISHDSLGYLAHRYDFKQSGVSGMNNEEPSQSDIINMVNSINKSKAQYILYEQNIPSKITDIVKEKTKAKTAKFHNMSVLTDKDQKDATYQSIMEENIKSLDKALNQ